MDYTIVKNLRPCVACGRTPNVEVASSIDKEPTVKIECSCGCTSVSGNFLASVAERWDRANDRERSYLSNYQHYSFYSSDEWKKAQRLAMNSFFGQGGLHLDPVERAFMIDKVISNDPATIVFWKDGTKTVVKAVNEPFDPEKGLAMAISKKALGNKGNYFNVFKKYMITEEEMAEADKTFASGELKDAIDEFAKAAFAMGGNLDD